MSGPQRSIPQPVARRIGRALEVTLVVLALTVFAMLWLYVAAALLTDGALLEDTWAWLTGLDVVAAVVAWLALLPLAVWLWAWQADLEPLLMGLVLVGLLGWTWIGLSGLGSLLRRRP